MSKAEVKDMINEIKNWALKAVPEKIAKENLTEQKYFNDCRLVLNIMVIQALTGAEYDPSKVGKDGKYKVSFNGALPTTSEVAEIAEIIDAYIETVEDNFLSSVSTSPDDMSINAIPDGSPSIKLNNKVNKKNLTNIIFGYDGQQAICKMLIDSADVIRIAALGEELRKKRNRNRILIIGGITLLVAAGAGAGYYFYNKNHNDNDAIDTDADVNVDEIPDDPDVRIDDETPIVEIDDETPVVEIA